MEARIMWPDIAKGVAILLVVVNHTGQGIINAGVSETSVQWQNFHSVCYAFMVPVFFFLSGLFSQRSSKGLKARSGALISRLLYPYLLWSVIQTALMILTKAGNRVPEWGDLPAILLDGWMQFWFLHCLILIMAVDLVYRRFRADGDLRLMIAVILVSIPMLGFSLPWRLGTVAEHLIYFEIGVFLAGKSWSSIRPGRVCAFLVMGLVGLGVFHQAGSGHGTPLRPLAAVSGILGCCCLAHLISSGPELLRVPKSILQKLGYYSLQIYVLHVIFAAATRVLLLKAGIGEFWVHMLIGTLSGVVCSVVVAVGDDRLIRAIFRAPNLSQRIHIGGHKGANSG